MLYQDPYLPQNSAVFTAVVVVPAMRSIHSDAEEQPGTLPP